MSEDTVDITSGLQDAIISRPTQDAVVDALQRSVISGFESTGSLTVDDFEDGDLTEYTGDTAAWTVDDTAPVFEGSFSAKCSTAGPEIISTSGLTAYLDQDETMAAQVYGDVEGTGAVAPQIAYFVQDIDNFYLAEAAAKSGHIRLYRKEAGSFTELVKVNVTVNNQTEYQLRMTPQADGTHVIELFDAAGDTQLASASATDTTYTDGGIGLRQGNTGSVVIDHLRLI